MDEKKSGESDKIEVDEKSEAEKDLKEKIDAGVRADKINKKAIKIRHGKTFAAYVRKYFQLCVGAVIAAVGLELFLIPNNVIDGGVVGLSIMASSVSGMSLGIFLILFNIPFLFLGYKQIGKSFAAATIVSICFLSFWSEVIGEFPKVTDDSFLAAIFGGIIDGIGVGLIMRAGGSLDGTEIVAIIMDRRSVWSVGEVVMFINLFILSGAGLLFGWDKAMYSLFAYYVISKTIDVTIKGLDESYAVMIVTNEPFEITAALNDRLGRGVTLLHGAGGYTGQSKEVLYCVVTRLEVDKLKEIVLDKDENAFVTINVVHDIVGGRFKKKSIH